MNNSLSLYDISNGFVMLMNQEEEITEDDAMKIKEELMQLLQDKSQNIVAYDRVLETTIDSAKKEEDRIKEFRKNLERKREGFFDYIKECMERMQKEKVETPIGIIRVKKCPVSVEVTHEDLIPKEFMRVKEVVEVNKKEIINNFKETGEVPTGVNMITNKTRIEIK